MNNEAARSAIRSPFHLSHEDTATLATGWSARNNLIGLEVYNEREEHVGSVSDLIVGTGGARMFAIVGVGGFLGLGTRDVAIPVEFFKLRDSQLILPQATEEALKHLPEFIYPAEGWNTYDFSLTAPTPGPRTGEHEAYWRERYASEPYVSQDFVYEDYAPAYRAGYVCRLEGHAEWEAARTHAQDRWDVERGGSRLPWSQAEPAVKAAWDRANRQYIQETGY